MRSSVAAARSSARRAAGANANSSPATSVSALPRHCPRAARSRLAASPRVAPGERLASGAGLGLEGDGVDRFWRHGEPVAGRGRLNHAVGHARLPERDPQPGDEGLQRVGRVSRPLVRPEPVDQRVGRHDAPRVQGEQDEQRAHPVPAHAHRTARRVAHLERAEHADPHRVRRRLHVALPARNPASRSGHPHASAKPQSRSIALSFRIPATGGNAVGRAGAGSSPPAGNRPAPQAPARAGAGAGAGAGPGAGAGDAG